MKKIFIFVILSLLTLCLGYAVTGDNPKPIKVYIDGKTLVFDVDPEITKGITMVTMRPVFESLNMSLEWDASIKKVTAEKENLLIELYIGSDEAKINNQMINLDTSVYIKNGRTMVPLRLVAESTGAKVHWNPDNNSCYIYTKKTISYPVVDTGVFDLFSDKDNLENLEADQDFYGQDGQIMGYQPNYSDKGDGTIEDLVTGLMWQKTMDQKMTLDEAFLYANESRLGGYDDWRIPTIKELFSLILFTGKSGGQVSKETYIDTEYFDQPLGNVDIGEREIDAQVWSSTTYVATTMHGDKAVFGVNFIDGRIKAYPYEKAVNTEKNKGYFRVERGNEAYGQNIFVNNNDGTISDLATGLMWQISDDGQTRNWQEALAYSQDLELAGYTDWRLPNIKELQSIVDYTKSLKTTNSPAIDDQFFLTSFVDLKGEVNYGYYWSSTSHLDGPNEAGNASYVAFGEAQGNMFGEILDVHGCGAVRSDPKSGLEEDYPNFFGPQGDVRYVYNFVLSVRDIDD